MESGSPEARFEFALGVAGVKAMKPRVLVLAPPIGVVVPRPPAVTQREYGARRGDDEQKQAYDENRRALSYVSVQPLSASLRFFVRLAK